MAEQTQGQVDDRWLAEKRFLVLETNLDSVKKDVSGIEGELQQVKKKIDDMNARLGQMALWIAFGGAGVGGGVVGFLKFMGG